MGCCISYISNLFNNKKHTIPKLENVQEIQNIKKNNIPKLENIKEIQEIQNINDNNYLEIIKQNYNKKNNDIGFTDYEYILLREHLNEKKIYNYIKTEKYIKYKYKVKTYKNDYSQIVLDKDYDNIIICENENDLYSIPPSPYMTYEILCEPDYGLNKVKKNIFIQDLNKIINNLEKIVKYKRRNFDRKIKTLNNWKFK